MIAIRAATLAVQNKKNTLRGGKGRDSKGSTSKGTGSKGGNRGESSERSKGVKIKSNGKGIFKGEGDPLKQRLVSRTQCRVCGEEVRSLGRRLPSSLKKKAQTNAIRTQETVQSQKKNR